MPTEHIHTGTFPFTDVLHRQGECEVELYRLESGAYVAIVTDLEQGASISNAVEKLATQVRRRFLSEGDALLWVEHFRPRRITDKDTYTKVLLRWDGYSYVEPHWEESTKREVERLIGRRLEE